MAFLGGDSEQEMDTREPRLSVDRADTLILLRYRVCSLWLAGSHMQTLCIAFAEVTYNERTLSPWHPCSALRWLRWHCQTNRDRPRAWSSWVLTNRRCLGRPGDLCDRPGNHRWRVCNKGKNTSELPASHPHLKWKIGNFMQEKKKTKTNVIGQEPSVFCEHTWQASPDISLSKYYCRTQAGLKELCSLTRPLCLTSLL